MTKEDFEKLKSTVKQWLFHTGSLDPTDYANELKLKFIEPKENAKLTERLKNTKEVIEGYVNERATNVDSRMVLEENKIINSNNSIHLNWNYSKDIPIPLDGKKRWIAYHSINENINSIKEISCSQDIIPTITDTIRYYAWTDEKLEMPKHPIELKN